MMRSRLSKNLSPLLWGLVLVAVPSAHAHLILAATVGGAPFCVVDNNAFACTHGTQLTDINSLATTMAWTASLGGVVLGGAQFSQMSVVTGNYLTSFFNIQQNTNSAPITGTFAISDTGFIPPATTAFAEAFGTWRGADGSTATLAWYNDPANAQGAESPADRPGLLVDTFADVATGDLDFLDHDGGPFAVADPSLFSMTLALDFTLAAGGIFSAVRQTEIKPIAITAVPEPGSLALLGAALGALGLSRRRKTK